MNYTFQLLQTIALLCVSQNGNVNKVCQQQYMTCMESYYYHYYNPKASPADNNQAYYLSLCVKEK